MKIPCPQIQCCDWLPAYSFVRGRSFRSAGVTLIEMTLVILVLLGMLGVGLHYSGSLEDWKRAKDAAEKLRSVYTAQKGYLADNPTVLVSTLTPAMLIPYMPNGETAIPTATSPTGATLTIDVDVSPPVLLEGTTPFTDPSGSTTDGLWDVGGY